MDDEIKIGSIWICGETDTREGLAWEVVDVRNNFVYHKYYHLKKDSKKDSKRYGSLGEQNVSIESWLTYCKPYYNSNVIENIFNSIEKIKKSIDTMEGV